MDERKLNITLLCGGISAEREVSLNTGAQIAEALRTVGHRVWQSDISPENLAALDRPCDLVFPALHGTFGEDGQLQRILEARSLPFVGSGEAASCLGMDKVAAKSCLLEHDVPTPAWQVVNEQQFKEASWEPAAGIGFPCVIKPISEGSSVGCRICLTLEQARRHLRETLPTYGAMLVEHFVDGYELTVGILDGKTLPAIWIKPATEFYDYEAKYTREDTSYFFDIPLPEKVLAEVLRISEETHRCIGCRHLSRVDVMVDKKTNEALVLEINTMPGFTTHSLVPKAAAKAGISFTELCDRLARMALRDAPVAARR
jgi:D-alanine-D-alanine ligase